MTGECDRECMYIFYLTRKYLENLFCVKTCKLPILIMFTGQPNFSNASILGTFGLLTPNEGQGR